MADDFVIVTVFDLKVDADDMLRRLQEVGVAARVREPSNDDERSQGAFVLEVPARHVSEAEGLMEEAIEASFVDISDGPDPPWTCLACNNRVRSSRFTCHFCGSIRSAAVLRQPPSPSASLTTPRPQPAAKPNAPAAKPNGPASPTVADLQTEPAAEREDQNIRLPNVDVRLAPNYDDLLEFSCAMNLTCFVLCCNGGSKGDRNAPLWYLIPIVLLMSLSVWRLHRLVTDQVTRSRRATWLHYSFCAVHLALVLVGMATLAINLDMYLWTR